MKQKVIIFLCILSLLISSINLAVTSETIKSIPEKPILTNISNNYDCNNLNLMNTSDCLVNEVSKWFIYNMTNWQKNITEEQLKNEGGTCWAYADWYDSQVKNLGFNSTEVIIPSGKISTHKFTVISNEEGYCILDQIYTWCFEFGEKNDT